MSFLDSFGSQGMASLAQILEGKLNTAGANRLQSFVHCGASILFAYRLDALALTRLCVWPPESSTSQCMFGAFDRVRSEYRVPNCSWHISANTGLLPVITTMPGLRIRRKSPEEGAGRRQLCPELKACIT